MSLTGRTARREGQREGEAENTQTGEEPLSVVHRGGPLAYGGGLRQLPPRPVHGRILSVGVRRRGHEFRVALGRGGTRVSGTGRNGRILNR